MTKIDLKLEFLKENMFNETKSWKISSRGKIFFTLLQKKIFDKRNSGSAVARKPNALNFLGFTPGSTNFDTLYPWFFEDV